jgi:hypothetical protein
MAMWYRGTRREVTTTTEDMERLFRELRKVEQLMKREGINGPDERHRNLSGQEG